MNATPSTIEAFPQVSGLRSQVSPRAPSGFAKLRTLLLRLIAPDTLEADLATEYITETHTGLDTCHASSTRTETLVERLRRDVTESLADGQIDAREKRLLARDQRALAQAAHQTTEQIESLR